MRTHAVTEKEFNDVFKASLLSDISTVEGDFSAGGVGILIVEYSAENGIGRVPENIFNKNTCPISRRTVCNLEKKLLYEISVSKKRLDALKRKILKLSSKDELEELVKILSVRKHEPVVNAQGDKIRIQLHCFGSKLADDHYSAFAIETASKLRLGLDILSSHPSVFLANGKNPELKKFLAFLKRKNLLFEAKPFQGSESASSLKCETEEL